MCYCIYFSADSNDVTANIKLPHENCVNMDQNKICKFFFYLVYMSVISIN